MTHAELVKRAERWLLNQGCAFALTELAAETITRETPDAIGWKDAKAILIECKTSRADFAADQKKWFRRKAADGLGRYRYYLCPKGVLQTEEMPEKWGLLWAYPKQTRKIKESAEFIDDRYGYGRNGELKMLISVIRRAHLRGLLPEICAPLNMSDVK